MHSHSIYLPILVQSGYRRLGCRVKQCPFSREHENGALERLRELGGRCGGKNRMWELQLPDVALGDFAASLLMDQKRGWELVWVMG